MDKQQREIQMFGYTQAALDASDERALGHPMMRIMSILSDTQEVLANGDAERARQMMNIAKYLISKHGFKDLEVAA
jgi:hypothetical protein